MLSTLALLYSHLIGGSVENPPDSTRTERILGDRVAIRGMDLMIPLEGRTVS